MELALGLFVIAAVGGLVMAARVWSGAFPPWWLSVLHALLGAAGIVVLLLALRGAGIVLGWWALAALVIAALGGFFLASFHLRKQTHPRGVVVLHGGLAALGVVLLIAALFQA
ncbi:hypothetical protein E5163_14995 [Marinicauda algicola]|uniref:Uncharacterized protein n=1 Tax=Marinicauda algicola TaxID=2029849 RepID=A0A4S2GX79_9PROT|nr:hypothetical protein [Marinicauda algicola]TGY87372.1 hypothetical protein E5163_14995 [Marinicauda algicola]